MTGLEAFILPVIQNVVGGYIKDRLIKRRESNSSRAELIGVIEKQLTDTRILEQRVRATEVVIRELDHLVRADKDLAWKDDELVIQPTGRVRKVMPAPEDALKHLAESIAARRAELGLPAAGAPALADPPEQAGHPRDGDLIQPDPGQGKPATDWQLRLAQLPSDVLREKERRTRKSGT